MELINTFPGFEISISHMTDGDMRNPGIFSHIIRSHPQVHGTTVSEYSLEGTKEFSRIDGIYTEISGVTIGALGADCPVLIFMGKGEVAAVHSGWRGTKAHISKYALAHFKKTQKSEIKVFIGPHIQKASYEVQKDFFENFPASYFVMKHEKSYFDIEAYLIDDLVSLGIDKKNIISHGGDTFSDARYFSYRRDGMNGVGCVSVEMAKSSLVNL